MAPRRPAAILPRMLRRLTLVVVLSALGSACHKEVLRYPHATPEVAAQAWADAFNRSERGQLRLLVHPDRRALFDEHTVDIEQQLRAFDIQKWVMGERVVVDGKLEGREIIVFLTDGSAVRENRAVLVQADGEWWLWKY